MISKEPLRVRITTDRDALDAIEAVEADGIPRVIERDGHAVAAIVSPYDFNPLDFRPSRDAVDRALATLGAWKDIPGTEDLAETIYRWRHESPPSPPVEL